MRISIIPDRYLPHILALLRIATALMFMQHGTAKLFGVPHVAMFDGLKLFSALGVGGVLDIASTRHLRRSVDSPIVLHHRSQEAILGVASARLRPGGTLADCHVVVRDDGATRNSRSGGGSRQGRGPSIDRCVRARTNRGGRVSR